MNPATLFGVMRHAQTLANREGIIQGHSDSPLSPKGERQAEEWGRALKGMGWQRIISSDLGRAVRTAYIINQHLGGLPHQTESGLRELDWGLWSGGRVEDLRISDPQLAIQEARGWDFHPPGGEDRRQMLARGLEALKRAARAYAGQKVLVVCHGGIMHCLVQHLMGLDFMPDSHYPLHGKGYRLHLFSSDGNSLRIQELNREF